MKLLNCFTTNILLKIKLLLLIFLSAFKIK